MTDDTYIAVTVQLVNVTEFSVLVSHPGAAGPVVVERYLIHPDDDARLTAGRSADSITLRIDAQAARERGLSDG